MVTGEIAEILQFFRFSSCRSYVDSYNTGVTQTTLSKEEKNGRHLRGDGRLFCGKQAV